MDALARALGRTRASLRIYDPYYCAGAVKKHLGALGFGHVHNEPVDFYASPVPPHDVVVPRGVARRSVSPRSNPESRVVFDARRGLVQVTNPPYSGDHPGRLLDCCRPGRPPIPSCLLYTSDAAHE